MHHHWIELVKWLAGALVWVAWLGAPPGGTSSMLSKDTVARVLGPYVSPVVQETTDNHDERVLLIGFDGFTWRQIQPLIDGGHMPNFQRIIENGVALDLTATGFPSSAASWPAIMTGCFPQNTGIHSFFSLDPIRYELRLNHAQYRKRKAIWEYVSEKKLPSFVINVPISWPPDPIDGIMIAGLLSPDDGTFTHPEAISVPLREAGYVTGYRQFKQTMDFNGDAFTTGNVPMDVNTLFDIALNRYQVVNYLMTKSDWRFGTAVFTLVDRFQHNQTQLGSPMIHHACRQMDVLLGGMLRALPPRTTVVICSDHGFRRYDTTCMFPEWLRRNRFMETDGHGKPAWGTTRIIPLDRVGNCGVYRINVRGRDSRGTVDAVEIPAVIDAIRTAALKLTDGEGRKVVHEIIPLSGEDGGPDLLVVLYPHLLMNHALDVSGEIVRELTSPVYDHEKEGIGVLYRPDRIRAGLRTTASVVDIAPTCLYLLGIPVPDDLDGRILTELVTDHGLIAYPIIRGGDSKRRSAEQKTVLQDEGVISQLKSLGYIN
ncbi:alkaline phosphatase family protein [bacterium]|nr:alkaline phosphatase family protein [candidate division CSSED10-310 bacterium]